MGDALLMAMSSSGLTNIVLEDFMEVVPAYDLSSSPEVKQEEVEMLAEFAPKPGKRQRRQLLNPDNSSSTQQISFAKAPIVPSFIKITNKASSLTNRQRSQISTGFPATVFLNKQREDEEAAERLLKKYKSAGKAELKVKVSSQSSNSDQRPITFPWGSSNAFNTNKQKASNTNNGLFRVSPDPKLETKSSLNVFGLGGGDTVKRTVILKNMEKTKSDMGTAEAAVDAKTTPNSIVMKPISALLEQPRFSQAKSSTKTMIQAESTEREQGGAKTTQSSVVTKPILPEVENPAQRYHLVAGTIEAILTKPTLKKAFIVQVYLFRCR